MSAKGWVFTRERGDRHRPHDYWANVGGIMRRVIRPFAVATCAVALAACATVARTPYTPQDQSAAVIPGIPDARVWADDPRIATEQPVVSGVRAEAADRPGAFRRRRRRRVRRRPTGGMVRARHAAAIHDRDGSQRRRADCPVRIPGAGLRRDAEERLRQRRDGKLAAIGRIGGTVRPGTLQARSRSGT